MIKNKKSKGARSNNRLKAQEENKDVISKEERTQSLIAAEPPRRINKREDA